MINGFANQTNAAAEPSVISFEDAVKGLAEGLRRADYLREELQHRTDRLHAYEAELAKARQSLATAEEDCRRWKAMLVALTSAIQARA